MGPGGGTSKERCSGLRAGIQRAAVRTSSDPHPTAHRQHLSGLGGGKGGWPAPCSLLLSADSQLASGGCGSRKGGGRRKALPTWC